MRHVILKSDLLLWGLPLLIAVMFITAGCGGQDDNCSTLEAGASATVKVTNADGTTPQRAPVIITNAGCSTNQQQNGCTQNFLGEDTCGK